MSAMQIQMGSRNVGVGNPVFIVAEIGINHNGDIEVAKQLIDSSAAAGADAVKFQKRTPELCVPDDQKDILRETPWGTMTYLDYRYKVEFDDQQYTDLEKYAKSKGIELFASPWDMESLKFLISHNHPAIKIASASLTDDQLVSSASASNIPVIASTGMSTMEQIDHAVGLLNQDNSVLCHTTSSYPCTIEELNLRMISVLRQRFNMNIGYSGHEIGLSTSLAAVSLGAVFLERHVTLNRAMWGSDQAASIEPLGFAKLVRDVRAIETALGDGVKRVYESELGPMKKLRLK